jgi:hypothetical protein
MSRFHQVIAWSFGTAVALYGLVTAFGFLTFGTCLLLHRVVLFLLLLVVVVLLFD